MKKIVLMLAVLFFAAVLPHARAASPEEIDRMLMVQDCTALVIAYGRVLDLHDLTPVPKIFAEDGVIDLKSTGAFEGIDAVTDFLTRYVAAQTIKHRHLITNILIEPAGENRATGTAYAADFFYDPAKAGEMAFFPVTLIGDFTFEFTRTDEGWRIARVTLVRDRAAGPSPLEAIREDLQRSAD